MARTVRDANLETRTARLRLRIRSEPYWRGLEKGFALGYRRRGKGGTWLARRRPDGGGRHLPLGHEDVRGCAAGVAAPSPCIGWTLGEPFFALRADARSFRNRTVIPPS